MPSCHGDEGVSPGPADLQDIETPSNASELSTGTTTTPRTDPESIETIFVSQASSVLCMICIKSCVTLKAGIKIYGAQKASHYMYYQGLKECLGEYLAHLKELRDHQEEGLNIDFIRAIAESLNLVAATQRPSPSRKPTQKTREHMRELRECVRETEKELKSLRESLKQAAYQLHENSGREIICFPSLPFAAGVDPFNLHEAIEDLDVFMATAMKGTSPEESDITTEVDVTQAYTIVSDNEESSSGDCWDLTARNGSRNPEDLLKNGLPPVWTSWGGYPGEVPQDIYEWFDDKTGIKNVQYIGPISSLFWLKGHDDLVEVCNDPAYTLEDEIRMVPNGTGLGFMIDEYFSEGKIPRRMFFRAMGYEHPPPAHVNVSIARINSLPRSIPRDPRTLPTESIHPLARRQCFPPSVRCFKMQRNKKTPTLLSKILQKAPDLMATGELWFRGTGMNAANYNLSFFIPSLSSSAVDNEFGPGLCTTNDLDYAAKYVMAKGAIMVFKNPDLRALNVWDPSPAEWKQLVCTWTQTDLPGVSKTMPQEYRQADMIRGPISERKQNKMVTAGDKQQLVAVSYKGCERLCASLHTIIYLCTEEEKL